uniref:Cytochrome b n=1 Tax=Hypochilus thorelli TaxID=139869 RepID=B2CKU2_HYPTH|nr:cytochrome b [Hypochilus thorelli]ACA62654.1 cytochrome b [Hypochilus thorelli]
MKVLMRKKNVVLSVLNGSLVDLPSPSSLSYLWNFGSLLGIFLMMQILTGLFLGMHFSSDVSISFSSVVHICRDVNNGWFIRILHSNGASMFFMLLYIHMGRGIYYGSYRFKNTWFSGALIFLISMAVAFLGYVLPWGQMSFWAATVITNLVSVIPYVGVSVVEWLWGGFAVGNPTLTRFFVFHFVLPFVILFMVILHLLFLHETGSNNSLGLSSNMDSVEFHPYYSFKDLYGFVLAILLLLLNCLLIPYIFMDSENFIPSNPLVTPIHIQPEWYFLFAYAILRSVPNKIGGVVALLMSVMVLFLFPLVLNHRVRSVMYYPSVKFLYWVMVFNWFLLMWIGACVVEEPFFSIGQVCSINYFVIFFLMVFGNYLQDKF